MVVIGKNYEMMAYLANGIGAQLYQVFPLTYEKEAGSFPQNLFIFMG